METVMNAQQVAPVVVTIGELLNVDLTRYFKLTRQGRLHKRDMMKCLRALAQRDGVDLRELAAEARAAEM